MTQQGQPGSDAPVKEKAAESAQAGKQAATDVAQTAADQAKNVAGEAQAQARNVVSEARDQLQAHAGDQHRNAVKNLRSLGDELRSMAGSGQQDGMATDLVRQAADRTHGVADWLDGREPGDIVDEVRRFARRRPGAFLVGALVAGVAAGRLTRGAVSAHQDNGSGPVAALPESPATSSPVTAPTPTMPPSTTMPPPPTHAPPTTGPAVPAPPVAPPPPGVYDPSTGMDPGRHAVPGYSTPGGAGGAGPYPGGGPA